MIEDRVGTEVRVGDVTIRTVDRVAVHVEVGRDGISAYASKRPLRVDVETPDGAFTVDLDAPLDDEDDGA